MSRRELIPLLAAIVFLLLSVLIFLPDYESPRVVKFLVVTQVLFALSVVIYLTTRKLDLLQSSRKLFFLLVLGALVARVIMLVGAGDKFYMSDDVYRYIWDGKVAAHGISPFLHSPRADELAHLKDTVIHPKINHPWNPTIYPPFSQQVFYIAYKIGGDTTLAFKLLCAVFELLTALGLYLWLRRSGRSPGTILLYLYSPLVLGEFYLSAHSDILAIPFLVATLLATMDRRAVIAGVLLGIATTVKFYGLLFAPFFLLELQAGKRYRFALAYVLTLALMYAPYLPGAGTEVFGSLVLYVQTWQYNSSVFGLLKQVLGFQTAKYVVGGAFAAWVVYILSQKAELSQKLFRTMAGYVVLTTTLFPWYYIWVLPFALVRMSVPFLLLSGTLLLSYHVHIDYYSTGEYSRMPWLAVSQYVPFYVLLIWSWWRQKQERLA